MTSTCLQILYGSTTKEALHECEECVIPCPPTLAALCSRPPPLHRPVLCAPNRWSAGGWHLYATHTHIQLVKKTIISSLSTITIRSQHLSRSINKSIKSARSGVRGHKGSGVTQTNCSVERGPCNNTVGGFISGTCANNKHFDPYTNTYDYYTIYTHSRLLQHTHFHTAGGVQWLKRTLLNVHLIKGHSRNEKT